MTRRANLAGLIVGHFWPPLGIAAAVGFALTVIGAVGCHVYADVSPGPRGNAMALFVLIPLSAATAATLTPAT
ncbi:hypothetical protein ACFVT5_39530 [Streptomyces sp. NPDC058001]|uniref:hypothetical protein n=1 Tax=Streptomyces sp. NPDC058001 TaxID=3346300 RepID=UPI0036E84CFF